MLNKYIKELVEANNRVIIPDFGAFMVQDTSTGKQISFNDFLKFNDGLLINQIIKAEKIGKAEASEKIKEYIKTIESCFSLGKPFVVDTVGQLIKDSQGNIKLEQIGQVATENSDKTAPQIVLEDKPVTDNEIKNSSRVETPTIKTEQKVENKNKISDTKKTEKVNTTKPLSKPSGSYPASSPNSGNSKNALIIVAAIVVVVGGFVAASFIFGWFGLGKSQKTEIVINEPAPVVDSAMLVADTLPEPEIVEEAPVEQVEKRFFIIAGSFKVPSNAERFNQKLIAEGYQSQIVIRKNGFHTVSYDQFETKQEALQAYRKYRQTNDQVWILIK